MIIDYLSKCCLAVALFLCLHTSAEAGRNWEDLTSAEKAAVNTEINSDFKSLFFGDVHMYGIVTDSASNQLADVAVRITVLGPQERTICTNITGQFSFAYTNCTLVTLLFEKEGYHNEMYRYNIRPDVTPQSSGCRVISNSNVAVVLDELGDITELTSLKKELVFSTTNSSWGVAVSNQLIELYEITSVTNDNEFLDDSFCLVALLENDIIPMTNIDVTVTNDGEIFTFNTDVPQEVALITFGDHNGIVPHSVVDVGRTKYDVFREMKEAPELGYTNKFILSVGRNYFYLKLGTVYGKGFVSGCGRTREDGKEIDTLLRLHSQTNGTRNLRTLN